MSQTWMITGANRGIGLEYVRQLLGGGHSVIATARDPEKARELQALAQANPKLSIQAVDLDDRATITALAARLEGCAIDVLFNNAGLYGGSWDDSSHRQSAVGMDFDLWEQIMRVNVMAPFLITQLLLPNLLQGSRKLVVNMSSDLGSITNNSQGQSYAYRSSKAALNMVTKGLSVDLASEGITVISMAPGWTKTDLGGMAAEWSVDESVARQLRVLVALTLEDSGSFRDLLGQVVPW